MSIDQMKCDRRLLEYSQTSQLNVKAIRKNHLTLFGHPKTGGWLRHRQAKHAATKLDNAV
jgi:hypothetical protein